MTRNDIIEMAKKVGFEVDKDGDIWCSDGYYNAMIMDLAALIVNAPPKKEWVGLTDEEVWHMSQFNCGTRGEFARAIEAKLKEKNT
jgi:hypothetical protein